MGSDRDRVKVAHQQGDSCEYTRLKEDGETDRDADLQKFHTFSKRK